VDTYTEVLQRVFIDLEDIGSASWMDALKDADVARSRGNIQQWMAYLPPDCIKRMIEMGWDVST
jgi:hypothetical protein